jgi:hypothetical protein
MWIKEREERLKTNCAGMERVDNLIFRYKIPPRLFSTVKHKALMYILECLHSWYDYDFELSPYLLNDYVKDILALPNITPNGLVLPKTENIAEYNSLHKTYNRIFSLLDLRNVEFVRFPISVRLNDGKPSEKDDRPRSSTKLHTDVWAGEFVDTAMLHMPLFGNMKLNGIELKEPPEDFYPQHVRIYEEFGGKELDHARLYNTIFECGYIYLIDSLVLHRTLKGEPNLRLLMTTHVKWGNKVSSDTETTSMFQLTFGENVGTIGACLRKKNWKLNNT